MSVVTDQNSQKMGNARYVVIIFLSPNFVVSPLGRPRWDVLMAGEVQYQVDGQTKTRKGVDPHSFRIVTNEGRGSAVSSRTFFTTGDERPRTDEFSV